MKRFLTILILLFIPFIVTADEENTSLDSQIDDIISKIPYISSYTAVNSPIENVFEFTLDNGTTATVSVDNQGNIINYIYQNLTYSSGKRLPAISKARAAQIAEGFAQNVAGDIFPDLNTRFFTNTYSNTSPAGFNIRFNQSVQGISYSGNNISIWVDAQTGNVTRFTRVWDKDINFAPIDSIISQEEANKKFLENIGLELRYNKKIIKGQVVPYLVFVPQNTAVIDGATGEAVSSTKARIGNSYNEMLALYEKMTISTMDFIPATGMVSGAKAQEHARTVPELGLNDKYSATQAIYSKNTNSEYLVTVDFERINDSTTNGNTSNGNVSNGTISSGSMSDGTMSNGTMSNEHISVTFDASNLFLVGFYNKEAEVKISSAPSDRNIAVATANAFVDKYLGEYKASLSRPRLIFGENGQGSICAVVYERMENGIIYKSNGASFTINSVGDIISYSFTWDNTLFDSPEGILSFNKAEEIFFDKIGLSLIYMKTADDTVRLVYTVNPQISAIIDAKAGELLSYDGSVAKGQQTLSYVDLENHYAKEQVTALADIDIFVSQGNVDLDKPIYQKDFIVLLASVAPDGMPIFQKQGGISEEDLDMLYSAFVAKGVLDKSEINHEGLVARQDAVKFLLRTTGYKDVAELPGIFKRHFKDSDFIDPALYGYVSLARGLNLIRGNNGYFYPDLALSNGDALIMVYNYLNRR